MLSVYVNNVKLYLIECLTHGAIDDTSAALSESVQKILRGVDDSHLGSADYCHASVYWQFIPHACSLQIQIVCLTLRVK